MIVIRFLGTVISVLAAALVGNWIGYQLRAMFTAEPISPYRLIGLNEEGKTTVDVESIRSDLLPALMAAFIGKPRWLFAFLGGIIYSGLFDDDSKEMLSSGLRLFKK